MTLLMWNTKCEGYPFILLSSGTFWSEAAIQSILSGNVYGKVGEQGSQESGCDLLFREKQGTMLLTDRYEDTRMGSGT